MEDISYFREKWGQRLNIVGNWLSFLKRELEAPDLWQSILDEKQLMQIAWSPALNDTQFTPVEKQHCIMARHTDTDKTLLAMALVGYEAQIGKIKAAIAEIQARLGHRGPGRPRVATDGRLLQRNAQ